MMMGEESFHHPPHLLFHTSTLKVVGETLLSLSANQISSPLMGAVFQMVMQKKKRSRPANILLLLHSPASFVALLALIISIFKLNVKVSFFHI